MSFFNPAAVALEEWPHKITLCNGGLEVQEVRLVPQEAAADRRQVSIKASSYHFFYIAWQGACSKCMMKFRHAWLHVL